MNIFVVFLSGTDSEAQAANLREKYPNHYELTNRVFLVSSDSLPDEVARNLSLDGTKPSATGIVFKMNKSFMGYHDQSVWNWLTQHD